MDGGTAQVVEQLHLPSKREALSSNSSTERKKKELPSPSRGPSNSPVCGPLMAKRSEKTDCTESSPFPAIY
jgi:hypothetical protein